MLSRADAEKKLLAVREEMFGQPNDKRPDAGALRQRYAEFQRKIGAAVKAGRLSRKDAEEKLIAVRKEMFGGRKVERRGRERIRDKRQVR